MKSPVHGWPRKPLGQVAEVVSGYAFKSGDFGDRGVPVIKIKNIRVGTVDVSEADRVDHKFLTLPDRYHVSAGDILISLTGSHISQPNSVVGRVARHAASLPHCLLNQRGGKVIVRDRNVCDANFLYYALSESATVRAIALKAHGAANQANVSPSQVESIEIPLPSLPLQQQMASILMTYDDLIENNTRRVKILEEMAQMIYREWFVSFRFPGHAQIKMANSQLGLIPRAWKVGVLEDALVLQRGFDLPGANRLAGNVPIYAATGVNGYHSVAKVKGPGVITGRSGSLGRVMLVLEDFWPLNTTLWIKEFRQSNAAHSFFLLSDLKLTGFNSGAAVPTLNRNDIHGLPCLLPDRDTLDAFNECVLPMFYLRRILEQKTVLLQKTRDLLLPGLISGNINVEHLETETVNQSS